MYFIEKPPKTAMCFGENAEHEGRGVAIDLWLLYNCVEYDLVLFMIIYYIS